LIAQRRSLGAPRNSFSHVTSPMTATPIHRLNTTLAASPARPGAAASADKVPGGDRQDDQAAGGEGARAARQPLRRGQKRTEQRQAATRVASAS
jgi:hypothetical protein